MCTTHCKAFGVKRLDIYFLEDFVSLLDSLIILEVWILTNRSRTRTVPLKLNHDRFSIDFLTIFVSWELRNKIKNFPFLIV